MTQEVSVKEQIKKLVELQQVDGQMYAFKKELADKPTYIEQLKEQFENKKHKLNELEMELKAKIVERNSKESELAAKDEAISRSNTQLSQIKTNKEYTAKITEIEGIRADKSIIEEQILASYDETDELKKSIDAEKESLSKEEERYLSEKKEVEASISEIEKKIKELGEKRRQIIPGIEKENLDRYEKILSNKEGVAIVPVSGSACGGCFMNVPPQVVNEIKMGKKLIYCEMCARILYLEEDL